MIELMSGWTDRLYGMMPHCTVKTNGYYGWYVCTYVCMYVCMYVCRIEKLFPNLTVRYSPTSPICRYVRKYFLL